MINRTLAILGAGGQGKVIADAALCMQYKNIIFFDDAWPNISQINNFLLVGLFCDFSLKKNHWDQIIIGIGNNKHRIKIGKELRLKKFLLATIIHPKAIISQSAKIGSGSVVFAGAVVNPSAIVGEDCIINTNAVIEHDCIISDGVHISPNASLGGCVKIGKGSWVGIGATVIPGVIIGENVIIGAGSVVIKDVMDNQTVVGVPARVLI